MSAGEEPQWLGLRQTRPAIRTRPEPLARHTPTTGLRPRRAHVVASAVAGFDPPRPGSRSTCPGAAANLLPRATGVVAGQLSVGLCSSGL
jgi:hypothetical protein